jgi:indolepyruvate ferredoxin oxidoreductase, beta subunit
MVKDVTNVVIAGLGGQGVVKASDVLARAAFLAGWDVKKSELHGMSQRGGSVASEVRFGGKVFSPMIPQGQADYLVALAPGEMENHLHRLAKGGEAMRGDEALLAMLIEKKSANVAMLGRLSRHLSLEEGVWIKAIEAEFPERLREANIKAFYMGRNGAR